MLIDYLFHSKATKKPYSSKSGGDKSGPKKDVSPKDGGYPKPSTSYMPKIFVSKKKVPKLCFICDTLHWTRDCPNRKAMNAIMAEYDNKEKIDEPQADLGDIQHLVLF